MLYYLLVSVYVLVCLLLILMLAPHFLLLFA